MPSRRMTSPVSRLSDAGGGWNNGRICFMLSHPLDLLQSMSWGHHSFCSLRLLPDPQHPKDPGEYSRLPVEASLVSCNRVESSSMGHSFPLQGRNGFISRKTLAASQWGQPALTNTAISGVGSPARTGVSQKNRRSKTDRPSCRVSLCGPVRWKNTNLVLTIIHERFSCNRGFAAVTSLRRAGSSKAPSTCCSSTPRSLAAPRARLAMRQCNFATNRHE